MARFQQVVPIQNQNVVDIGASVPPWRWGLNSEGLSLGSFAEAGLSLPSLLSTSRHGWLCHSLGGAARAAGLLCEHMCLRLGWALCALLPASEAVRCRPSPEWACRTGRGLLQLAKA